MKRGDLVDCQKDGGPYLTFERGKVLRVEKKAQRALVAVPGYEHPQWAAFRVLGPVGSIDAPRRLR